jgi:hypothetical protein
MIRCSVSRLATLRSGGQAFQGFLRRKAEFQNLFGNEAKWGLLNLGRSSGQRAMLETGNSKGGDQTPTDPGSIESYPELSA